MTFPSAGDLNIANQALGQVRARTQQITSFSAPGPEATQIRLNYASTRDALLRQFYWNFAKQTVLLGSPTKTFDATLTAWTAAQPAPPWTYEYAYPTGCVAIRSVMGQPAGAVPSTLPNAGAGGWVLPKYNFEIANNGTTFVILTDAPSALAVITNGGLDPALWDIEFQQAMVAALALSIVLPLSGDLKLAQKLEADAKYWLDMAKMKSANEGTEVSDIMPDWIDARVAGLRYEGVSVGGQAKDGQNN